MAKVMICIGKEDLAGAAITAIRVLTPMARI